MKAGLAIACICSLGCLLGYAAGNYTNTTRASGCKEAWAGYNTRYSKHVGCLIQLENGNWAPESAIRITVKEKP